MADTKKLVNELKIISKYSSALALLAWDEEVNLPENGHGFRGEVLALLSAEAHKRITSPKLKKQVYDLAQPEVFKSLNQDDQVIVRETKRDIDLATKLPVEFVERTAQLTSEAFGIWANAREESNYKKFEPILTKTIKLKQEEAELIGYEHSPYDALLDSFEPGLNVREVDNVFIPLANSIARLVDENHGNSVKKLPSKSYDIATQQNVNRLVISTLGYDLQGGRVDASPHPFETTIHSSDVRVTTRYDDKDFWVSLGSVIHEAGHAMYEQGLPAESWGTPLGEALSLSIHESQSRLWENLVAKSPSFISYLYPILENNFGELGYSETDLFMWINRVELTPIRVESDEVTYNLHIILRYELEKALIEGSLSAADLPAAWNEKVKKYLGLDIKDDALGVLQDVHWAHGAFGYFPSYTLGNLNAAQLYNTVKKQIPGLEESFAKGNFKPLLVWLRQNIHKEGRRYSASQLIEKITGEKLNAKYLIDHLEQKVKLNS